MNPLIRAREIAVQAHQGQRDKAEHPYFDHCRRVAEGVCTDEEKTVAYLHDVLEKGPGWTQERLRQEGFSARVVEAVVALTRKPEEDENDFVRRAASNSLARVVKLADLKDNLAQSEQAGLDSSKYVGGLQLFEEL